MNNMVIVYANAINWRASGSIRAFIIHLREKMRKQSVIIVGVCDNFKYIIPLSKLLGNNMYWPTIEKYIFCVHSFKNSQNVQKYYMIQDILKFTSNARTLKNIYRISFLIYYLKLCLWSIGGKHKYKSRINKFDDTLINICVRLCNSLSPQKFLYSGSGCHLLRSKKRCLSNDYNDFFSFKLQLFKFFQLQNSFGLDKSGKSGWLKPFNKYQLCIFHKCKPFERSFP